MPSRNKNKFPTIIASAAKPDFLKNLLWTVDATLIRPPHCCESGKEHPAYTFIPPPTGNAIHPHSQPYIDHINIRSFWALREGVNYAILHRSSCDIHTSSVMYSGYIWRCWIEFSWSPSVWLGDFCYGRSWNRVSTLTSIMYSFCFCFLLKRKRTTGVSHVPFIYFFRANISVDLGYMYESETVSQRRDIYLSVRS